MKLRLVSKKLGSKSLRLLAEGLSTKLGYKVWRSKHPKLNQENLLYGDCKDKLTQYEWFKQEGIPAPEFTVCHQTAKEWANSGTVLCRTLTRASEGKGIVVAETAEEVVLAPVYTKYKKKKKEYRVHVFKDSVVSVLEKRKRKGFDNVNTKIRNTANGYVFCREDVVEPEGIRELAIKASKVTNSNFKGVDIGYNELKNELFVIEVNSAPGLQGSTINDYVKVITNAAS